MLDKPLTQIEEADLQALVSDQVQEGLALEFKSQLNLGTTSQKKEAAKDASALANTAGGRIFYGINEAALPDGTVVASGITPLTDGALPSSLADILHSTIHPRPRFNLHTVPIAARGYVLALETYESSGLDLHMVTGYGDNRFYRRGPTGVVPMTEPEIREAYIRIGERRASLEARVENLVRPELETRAQVDESVLVIPLYSRPDLMDPRQVGKLGQVLRDGPFKGVPEVRDELFDLRLRHEGYRLLLGGAPDDAGLYLAVLKNGVVHLSSNVAFEEKVVKDGTTGDSTKEWHYWSLRAARRILWTLMIAREVFLLSAYSGPVRLQYQVRPTEFWRIEPNVLKGMEDPIAPGTYSALIAEANLESTLGSWGSLVKDLLDPIFHAAGDFFCPHITNDGAFLRTSVEKHFDVYASYVRITP